VCTRNENLAHHLPSAAAAACFRSPATPSAKSTLNCPLLLSMMVVMRGSPAQASDINPPHEAPLAATFVVSMLW
jgi:hypothetical protein